MSLWTTPCSWRQATASRSCRVYRRTLKNRRYEICFGLEGEYWQHAHKSIPIFHFKWTHQLLLLIDIQKSNLHGFFQSILCPQTKRLQCSLKHKVLWNSRTRCPSARWRSPRDSTPWRSTSPPGGSPPRSDWWGGRGWSTQRYATHQQHSLKARLPTCSWACWWGCVRLMVVGDDELDDGDVEHLLQIYCWRMVCN